MPRVPRMRSGVSLGRSVRSPHRGDAGRHRAGTGHIASRPAAALVGLPTLGPTRDGRAPPCLPADRAAQARAALHAHAGDKAEAVRIARLNIAAFEGVDVIVVNAAGCGDRLESYAHLLEDGPNWAARAAALVSRGRGVSEYMQSIVGDNTLGDH